MTRNTTLSVAIAVALTWNLSAAADAVVIDFDDYPTPGAISDPEGLLGNFYAAQGVVFTTPWYAYDEDAAYPAHSGTITAIGNPPPAEIEFLHPVANVGAYFNSYLPGLLFSAYDSGGLLGSVEILPTTQPTPGGPIYYELPYTGIERVTLTGNLGYYNLDDLTFTNVPEPSSLAVACLATLAVAARRWRKPHAIA